MYLPLSRAIPLRDSTVWGRFASIQAIPRIYGRATVAPVPYDDTGRLFVVADHPVQTVVSVSTDNQPVSAYRLYHQADSTGKTVAFLELQTAITIGSTALAVTVEGMQHPITGRLMTNPADVAWDLIQWATGKIVDRNRFARFAVECANAGVEVHGAIINQTLTIRALLDQIMDSVGATWSMASPDFALLWPVLYAGGPLQSESGFSIESESGGTIYV